MRAEDAENLYGRLSDREERRRRRIGRRGGKLTRKRRRRRRFILGTESGENNRGGRCRAMLIIFISEREIK